jgi:serine/threonine protein phosphatase PrpC
MVLPELSNPETFLICTDGLFDMVSLDGLESCLVGDRRQTVSSMFSAACASGGQDNVSILLLEVTPIRVDGQKAEANGVARND